VVERELRVGLDYAGRHSACRVARWIL
jgi:hypothetical protein